MPKPLKPLPGPLLPKPLLVTGHLVTLDPAQPELPDGALYIDRDGVIQAVQPRAAAPPPGFADVNRVDTGGLVYPGLIDLHNHIAYNCLPLWTAPDRTIPWTSRDQWPNDPDYKPSISLPANAECHADGEAVLRYVETKAVVGGVTAVQGSAKVATPFEGWMVRNIEFETFGTHVKTVNQSVRAIADAKGWAGAQADLDKGHAFIYHLAEGTDPKLLKDYDGMRDQDCLRPKFIGIHSTALHDAQYKEWKPRGGSIVWSPFSNLWLYGATTDVKAADQAGMRICLGADWSPSGSKNLLGELKVADLYNREQLAGYFTAEAICRMATCNPAAALGWDDKLGRLKAGLRGDFLAIRQRKGDAYQALIASTEPDVLLVAINGYPMYGTDQLMRAAAAVNPEPIELSPTLKRTITLVDHRFQAEMTWPQILAALEKARNSPPSARKAAIARKGDEAAIVALHPDKHWDDPTQHPELVTQAQTATIPPPDTLTHDKTYFDHIDHQPLHGGKLHGLRAYYDL
jgi:cytosine/adenosine deaminase-related metal-dependent hydrolase